MSLFVKSNLILSNLNSLSSPDYIEEIFDQLSGSSLNVQTPLYEEALNFYRSHKRFPDAQYLKNLFGERAIDIVERPLSIDLIYSFILELKEDVLVRKADYFLKEGKVDDAETVFSEIRALREKKEGKEFTATDAFELYQERKKYPSGILLGVPELDNVFKSLSYGTLTIIAGRPGHGKTTLGISLSYLATQVNGFNGCFLSLELPKDFVINRFLSRHSYEMGHPIANENIENNLLTEEDEKLFEKTVKNWEDPNGWNKVPGKEDYQKGKLFIRDAGDFDSFSKSELSNMFYRMDEKIKKDYKESDRFKERIENGETEKDILDNVGLDFVTIDYAQLIGRFRGQRDDVQFVNDVFRFLVFLAGVFNGRRKLILIVLSQLNRDTERSLLSSGRIETNTGLAEYNVLERESHRLLQLYAPDSVKNSGQMQGQITKNRTGQTLSEMVSFFCDWGHFVVGTEELDQIINTGTVMDVSGDIEESFFM